MSRFSHGFIHSFVFKCYYSIAGDISGLSRPRLSEDRFTLNIINQLIACSEIEYGKQVLWALLPGFAVGSAHQQWRVEVFVQHGRFMIDTLVKLLHAAEIKPTPDELADTLWLALAMGSSAEQGSQVDPIKPTDRKPKTPPNGSPSKASTATLSTEQRISLYAESEKRPTTDAQPMGGRPFRTPAATMLPNALALDRALRPLMRKVASQTDKVLDEGATVQRIAEQRLWLPVLTGKLERWLDVALPHVSG